MFIQGRRAVTATLSAWVAVAALGSRLPAAPLTAVVSILPQVSFVERIGGARVEVRALVPPGQSPATYAVTARQMAWLTEADVYFRIGVPFETALLPGLRRSRGDFRVVDTRAGIPLRRMERHGHDSGRAPRAARGPVQSAGADPHIWLDPKLVIRQSQTICETLVELDAAGEPIYRANLAGFVQDLQNLHARLLRTLKPVRGRAFMAFHPAWGYFADAYGLRQVPIEMEGKSPSARQLAKVIELAREEGVGTLFVQPQFDRRSAQAVATAIGGTVTTIDSLAPDYITNLARVAAEIARGLTTARR